MKINIENNINDTITLSFRPQTKEEFYALKNIWERNNNFEKLGYFIPDDAATHHGIDNSDFTILIRKYDMNE